MVRKSTIGWIIGGVVIIVSAIVGTIIFFIIKRKKSKKKKTCDPPCGTNEICIDDKCEHITPGGCDPPCGTNEICINGKCEHITPGECHPPCKTDEICIDKKCKAINIPKTWKYKDKTYIICNPDSFVGKKYDESDYCEDVTICQDKATTQKSNHWCNPISGKCEQSYITGGIQRKQTYCNFANEFKTCDLTQEDCCKKGRYKLKGGRACDGRICNPDYLLDHNIPYTYCADNARCVWKRNTQWCNPVSGYCEEIIPYKGKDVWPSVTFCETTKDCSNNHYGCCVDPSKYYAADGGYRTPPTECVHERLDAGAKCKIDIQDQCKSGNCVLQAITNLETCAPPCKPDECLTRDPNGFHKCLKCGSGEICNTALAKCEIPQTY